MDLEGGAPRQLRGGDSWLPRWSPDGSRITFVTCIPNQENGPFPMCDVTYGVIDADGSNERMLVQTSFSGTIPPAEWSPDGRAIAFVGGEEGRSDLHVIHADGSGVAQLTRLGTVTGAQWSPDGRALALRAGNDRIAFSVTLDPLVWESPDPESLTLHVINADGTDRTTVAADAENPRWLRDGRSLSFDRSDGIWIVSAEERTISFHSRRVPCEMVA